MRTWIAWVAIAGAPGRGHATPAALAFPSGASQIVSP